MIHIFFVPGMFGSTLEYVLRNFTAEMQGTDSGLKHDGSMHLFQKLNHIVEQTDLEVGEFKEINTVIYPFHDQHLCDILDCYPKNQDDSYVLVYAKSFADAELNILFQYHKIALHPTKGIHIFYGTPKNAQADVSRWNSTYTQYSDLKPWEFREWFSIFYPTYISEWQNSISEVPDSWLTISSHSVLFDSRHCFENVIKFCNLTPSDGIDQFVDTWQQAQQYILDEYKLIESIVDCTVNQKLLSWKPLHIIAEAMIQQKLRLSGYEMRCDGLDVFPTDSIGLYKLLYPQ